MSEKQQIPHVAETDLKISPILVLTGTDYRTVMITVFKEIKDKFENICKE